MPDKAISDRMLIEDAALLRKMSIEVAAIESAVNQIRLRAPWADDYADEIIPLAKKLHDQLFKMCESVGRVDAILKDSI